MVNTLRQKKGQHAEMVAHQFLHAEGLRLIQQNYHCRYGEIDLIMQDSREIVFIEVRSRSRIDYGTATDSINRTKIIKIIKSATHFLQQKNWLHTLSSRFDVIAIHPINGKFKLEWIKSAFTSDVFSF